ncbi:hypothetical protein B0T17DRAFT_511861 [Bombardia bombarda]|uniref:Uncharacterized protein n=1 Tax=Bombardia bombarda TaxID=252184 RepID=A0AA39TGS1_9PEZI|nr:hypothetical protein B0T17DRAFT_511861 [Bombardia bombarda]
MKAPRPVPHHNRANRARGHLSNRKPKGHTHKGLGHRRYCPRRWLPAPRRGCSNGLHRGRHTLAAWLLPTHPWLAELPALVRERLGGLYISGEHARQPRHQLREHRYQSRRLSRAHPTRRTRINRKEANRASRIGKSGRRVGWASRCWN